MENPIESLLVSLGICDLDSIVEFYPCVRDRDDVKVMRCAKSGVIFLSRSDHAEISHYQAQPDLSYWSAESRAEAMRDCFEDDSRRAVQFGPMIRGKRWLDVGTGVGGILELLRAEAAEASAVEPQPVARRVLQDCGYTVYEDISCAAPEHFDVITLFHVFEHLSKPVDALRAISGKLVRGGSLILEVPHANDFLISFLNLDAFKKFTFWSEHLILHTRQSLYAFLRAAGLPDIQVSGWQRYPLANHLYWLASGKPGGHKTWSCLVDRELDEAYQAVLDRMDRTDTLIAVARK